MARSASSTRLACSLRLRLLALERKIKSDLNASIAHASAHILQPRWPGRFEIYTRTWPVVGCSHVLNVVMMKCSFWNASYRLDSVSSFFAAMNELYTSFWLLKYKYGIIF